MLLRRTAENTLAHVVLTVFGRVPEFAQSEAVLSRSLSGAIGGCTALAPVGETGTGASRAAAAVPAAAATAAAAAAEEAKVVIPCRAGSWVGYALLCWPALLI